jgi:hypothetical protein
MNKKLLIAGIDPGTTVGYAFIDLLRLSVLERLLSSVLIKEKCRALLKSSQMP